MNEPEYGSEFDNLRQRDLTNSIMTSVQLIKAIELLTKARDQVGVKLYQEIQAFLTGLKEEP